MTDQLVYPAGKKFPVVEIFGPTIEGEGALSGVPTHFVRFGFCDGAGRNGWCKWCDSMFAVDPKYKDQWRYLDAEAIVRELKAMPRAPWVKFSGGNPLLHNLEEVARNVKLAGFRLSVETQGTIYQRWLDHCDLVVLSPKPPSAGSPWTDKRAEMLDRYFEEVVENGTAMCVKVVCDPDNEADRAFAKQMYDVWADTASGFGYHEPLSFYVTCLTQPTDTRDDLGERYRRLAEWVVTAGMPEAHVGLQLHVIAWMHRQGV